MLKTKIKNKLLIAGLMGAGLTLLSSSLSAKSLGPELNGLMSTAAAHDVFEVIVTFDGEGAINPERLNVIESAGVIGGISFKMLPIVGITATKAQIEQIYASNKVRSVYFNAPLSLENDGATQITGVDRLRDDSSMRSNGQPFSGRGIGVVVNDSGVDGTHTDIKFPNHVVQNVLAQTNLHSLSDILPITYQEDTANTDIAGGHGSHVAGIIGGNGAMSIGKYQGVAPGANIIGYGSGAGLFILDTIGGFDYALTHQHNYNIRVISNSFGSTSDTGTDFNPDHPTNVATKKLSDNGVIVVFSAGNSGSGEATITGNFKKAPWVVTVAAGDKEGRLADFSSRGVKGKGGQVTVDGEVFYWEDRPTVTAPGVDIISVRASLSSLSALSIADDSEVMAANQVPYYTSMSGTSMSAPHVAGVIALMLEANPNLQWREVKAILQATATNMPGRETWEAGAGYVNAYAAVKSIVDESLNFGTTTKLERTFNAQALTSVEKEYADSVPYSPIGDDSITIEVSAEASMVMVRANVTDNTVGLSLVSPSGKRFSSSISLPVLGQNIAVTAPAEAGDWTLSANGIGGLSGVDADPTGISNGYAVPGDIDVTVKIIKTDGYTGLDDIEGHPAKSFIEYAVSEELVDAKITGYEPNAILSRQDLADFLTLGAGIRQSNLATSNAFNDVDADAKLAAAINAVNSTGAALRNTEQMQAPVLLGTLTGFNPQGGVDRTQLAYSLVQSLALQPLAESFNGEITVVFQDQRIALADQGDILAEFKGYVQLALDLGILNAYFEIEQGAFDLEPSITANFNGTNLVSRGDYAVAVTRFLNNY
ncbi:S8 family serine peptidase [Colwellia sp. MB3u-70]|uniref:S8 family serine peptidase n=1 Tax=unclassified Colwellia TaxID=196834 RepID=UPI0015F57DF4|nr:MULTISPECIES: S8 family serine peptidase [unclassified Colwellia]MBA6291705.1 S8 family serine peptidase [Colwellia sp. MB3u-8]MBA6308349.1 S8 family serine peptidase [Colwellia sp. MB3u-70]